MSSPEAIEIPLIKATNESLKGYGYLIDSYEKSDIEIVTWPKQGWREIDKGTGNEGGYTEGSFDTWWEGDTLYGQNNAVEHKSDYEVDGKLGNWEDIKVLQHRGNKVQINKGKKNDTKKIISFYTTFDEENIEILVEEVLAVIKWNKDLEDKNELLNLKMLELKKMFNENNVDSLRRLNFNFDNILESDGQEDPNSLVQ